MSKEETIFDKDAQVRAIDLEIKKLKKNLESEELDAVEENRVLLDIERYEKEKEKLLKKQEDTKEEVKDTGKETKLPEGFREVVEGEIIPAGDYDTHLDLTLGKTITNAPKIEKKGNEENKKVWTEKDENLLTNVLESIRKSEEKIDALSAELERRRKIKAEGDKPKAEENKNKEQKDIPTFSESDMSDIRYGKIKTNSNKDFGVNIYKYENKKLLSRFTSGKVLYDVNLLKNSKDAGLGYVIIGKPTTFSKPEEAIALANNLIKAFWEKEGAAEKPKPAGESTTPETKSTENNLKPEENKETPIKIEPTTEASKEEGKTETSEKEPEIKTEEKTEPPKEEGTQEGPKTTPEKEPEIVWEKVKNGDFESEEGRFVFQINGEDVTIYIDEQNTAWKKSSPAAFVLSFGKNRGKVVLENKGWRTSLYTDFKKLDEKYPDNYNFKTKKEALAKAKEMIKEARGMEKTKEQQQEEEVDKDIGFYIEYYTNPDHLKYDRQKESARINLQLLKEDPVQFFKNQIQSCNSRIETRTNKIQSKDFGKDLTEEDYKGFIEDDKKEIEKYQGYIETLKKRQSKVESNNQQVETTSTPEENNENGAMRNTPSRSDMYAVEKEEGILNKEVWEVPLNNHSEVLDTKELEKYEKINSLEDLLKLDDDEQITDVNNNGARGWHKVRELKEPRFADHVRKQIEKGLILKGAIDLNSDYKKPTKEDIEKANSEGKYEQAVKEGRMTLEMAIKILESAQITPSEEFIKIKKEMRGVKEGESIIGKLFDQKGDLREAGMFAVDEPHIEGPLPLIKDRITRDAYDSVKDEKDRDWKVGETIIHDGEIDRIIGFQHSFGSKDKFAYLLSRNEGDIDHRPTNIYSFEKFENKNTLIEKIKESLEKKRYSNWIKEGRMTVGDAVKIIQSASLEVPEEIKNLEKK